MVFVGPKVGEHKSQQHIWPTRVFQLPAEVTGNRDPSAMVFVKYSPHNHPIYPKQPGPLFSLFKCESWSGFFLKVFFSR